MRSHSVFAAFAFGFCTPVSTARGAGFDATVLRPAPVGRGTAAIPATDTLQSGQVEGSLVVSYADDPVELRDPSGQTRTLVLDHQTTLHGQFSLGLPWRLEAGVALPFVLRSDFTGDFDRGRSSAGIGDVDVALRWNPVASSEEPFGIAVSLGIGVPTGNEAALAGADAAVGTWTTVLDRRAGPFRVAATAGLRIRSRESAFQGGTVGHQALYGGSIEAALDREGRFVVSGEVVGARAFEGGASPLEALGAVRYGAEGYGLMLAAGPGLSSGIGAPDYRVLGGLSVRTPAGAAPPPDEPPAPPPRPPRPRVEDADGDGVFDDIDRCPRKQEDLDSFEDMDGCPEPDNDGDGFPDALDRCTNEPETRNDFRDEDGCPDEAPAFVFTTRQPLVFHDIVFRRNSEQLLPAALPLLDRIAESLRAQPDVHVRVEGHADDTGTARHNLNLSGRRARAVVDYLVGAGIGVDRLEYQGFGEQRPIAPNASAEGRRRNRRVEFHTLDHEGPEGEER